MRNADKLLHAFQIFATAAILLLIAKGFAADWRDENEKFAGPMGRGTLGPVEMRHALRERGGSARRSDEPTPTPMPSPPLHGTHRFEITAVDTESGERIEDFTVHTAMIVEDPDASQAARRVRGSMDKPMIRVARFESLKSVKGSVNYHDLPDGHYEFQVITESHFPIHKTVVLPTDSQKLEMRLHGFRSLKGRLVDASSSAPILDMAIEFHTKEWPKGCLLPRNWERSTAGTVSGPDGVFEFKQLPPAVVYLYFPEIPKNEGELDQLVRKRVDIIPEDIVGEDRVEAREWLSDLVAAEFGYMIPNAEADLTTETENNIGDVLLHKLPVLDLEVVDESEQPLRHAWYSAGGGVFRTDAEGRAQTRLWGFTEGGSVSVIANFNKDDLTSELNSFRNTRNTRMRSPFAQAPDESDNSKAAFIQAAPKEMTAGGSTAIIQPKPNETVAVKLVVKPSEEDYRIRLYVVDAETGNPIPEFEVVADRSGALRAEQFPNSEKARQRVLGSTSTDFKSARPRSGDGHVIVHGIRYDQYELEQIKHFKNPTPDYPLPTGKWADRTHYRGVMIFASGYIREVFSIHYDSIFNDEEVTLKLEPEAVVKGVVMLAGDPPKPITPSGIRAMWTPIKSEGEASKSKPNPIFIHTYMKNDGLQPKAESLLAPRFVEQVQGTVEEDGTFRFSGLKPATGWMLSVGASGLPGFIQRGIELKPGENDLGRVVLGAAGKLSGYLLDDQNEPISPASITFPMGGPEVEIQTDGSFETTLEYLKEDEQLVRITPSWSVKAGKGNRYHEPRIYFELVKQLNRYGENHWTPQLERGRTLTVRVTSSEAAITLAIENLKPENNIFEDGRVYLRDEGAEPMKYRIVAASLLRLNAKEDEPVYHQMHLLPRDGLPMEGIQTLQLENVPSGRMALIVYGSVFRAWTEERLKDLEPERVDDPRYGREALLPIVFQEFVMPSGAHSLDAEISSHELEFELDGDPPTSAEGEGLQITLEREGPKSYSFGGSVQRSLNSASSSNQGEISQLNQPIVGLFGSLTYDGSKNARIFLAPPGSYRLRAWTDVYEMMSPNGRPHYETTVEIRADDSKVKVSIPAPKAK